MRWSCQRLTINRRFGRLIRISAIGDYSLDQQTALCVGERLNITVSDSNGENLSRDDQRFECHIMTNSLGNGVTSPTVQNPTYSSSQ